METKNKQRTLKEKVKDALVVGTLGLGTLGQIAVGSYLVDKIDYNASESIKRHNQIKSQISTIKQYNLEVDYSDLKQEFENFSNDPKLVVENKVYKRKRFYAGLPMATGCGTILPASLFGIIYLARKKQRN